MAAEDEEVVHDCAAQVKRARATPLPTFDETCDFIGSGRFTSDQLMQLAQIAQMQCQSQTQQSQEKLHCYQGSKRSG